MPQATRLPNAPLSEVVFEMRWGLQGGDNVPRPLRVDPGYPILADQFADGARKVGFPVMKELHGFHEITPYSIVRRFYKNSDSDFPLLQIGPGIFAVNDSSQYEWNHFKGLVLQAIGVLVSSYPKLKSFGLCLNHLELRYINVFDKELVGTTDFLEFAYKATQIDLKLPDFLSRSKQFGRHRSGRFELEVPIKGMRGTGLRIAFGSGQRAGQSVVRLDSKVLTTGKFVPTLGRRDAFMRRVAIWLEDAHAVTSPFFRAIVKPEVMKKFE